MKKLFFIILINFYLQPSIYCQNLTPKDVIDSKSIVFYGYDFSDFKLTDSKRIGQDLKKYVFNLTGFFQEHLPEKKMQKWLEKDTISFNLKATVLINEKINKDEIPSSIKHMISNDSIQNMVNKYTIDEKTGIGYVIIFECFNSYEKTVTAYSAFFDISTKKVIIVDYASIHDNNSFNRISDWNPASFRAVKKLTDIFLDRVEKAKK